MIRKILKKKQTHVKIKAFIDKYKIPREYLSINRKSISRGVLVGLFWAFIPMPMQMLAVLAITPFMKFNVPIAISMVWLSNPITMPFMYYIEYITGNFLLGNEGLNNIELTLNWFSDNWDKIITPLYVGTIPYSFGISTIVYFIINKLWIDSVKKETSQRRKKFLKFRKK
ncbi:MAG: Unknown protein [uncultured Sulfurovum sp.]|uniref:DUF2062 domain-containing protein n=1 Tax=uncultured Sulfurovum sp. TaxID=269237 RepID=A0A6S6SXC9_9BACT|nr:MAG: Unknown protein [uncultured Sulfurovum sp.]